MQQRFRSFIVTSLVAAGIGVMASAFAVPAKADQWDKLTYLTIHERVIAGNKVLEPGTYVWKLLDSQSDRHIVQIFDKDQLHIEETILAVPNYRLQPTGESRFSFWETPPGVPKAIRAWFYPGDNFGQEFKYPKKLIAQFASIGPVPISESYREPEPAAAPSSTTVVVAAPEPAAAEPAPAPEPQPVQDANNSAAPAPQQSTDTLPHTASNIPLIAFLGLASFGLAGMISLVPKRR
jgi:hypothetical protein